MNLVAVDVFEFRLNWLRIFIVPLLIVYLPYRS
jgi:hypothetical protein